MEIYQAIILGVVQGLTEFLPISSSAHLILLPQLTDLPDQGLAFDIVVHFGTLMAVMLYYRQDISQIISSFFTQNPKYDNNARIGWGLILATIPVGIFGVIFQDIINTDLRSTTVIAYATIIFGLLLYFADFVHKQQSILKDEMTIGVMFIVGVFQVLSLIPGTSRSGITITAALLLGFNYRCATKFAFLLSIPVIILSMLFISFRLFNNPQDFDFIILFIGFSTSFFAAYMIIYFFIKLIQKISMLPFVIYRLILGFILLSL
jgi:undecaprenyl-diphosphatase